MKYPNYKDYKTIYEKYINRKNMMEMMDLAGTKSAYVGQSFLDLCCGDGAASREAIIRGAVDCLMVDQEKDMVASDLIPGKDGIEFVNYSIEDFLCMRDKMPNLKQLGYDIVFCRQGINYWHEPIYVFELAKWMNPGGVFIFNTFNTCPTREPMVKEYEIDSVHFAEVSYLVGERTIHHVQIREGYPPHLTKFKWVIEEEFKDGLDGTFDYEIRRKNNTDIYICRKK